MAEQDNKQDEGDLPDDRRKRPLALPPSVQPSRWMYHPLTGALIIGLVLGFGMFAKRILRHPEVLLDRPKTDALAPMPVPTKTAENGWPLYEKPEDGFSLALPPDWQQFEMNRQALETALQDSTQRDAALANLLRGLEAQAAQGIRFFGCDMSTLHSGFTTNVIISKERLPGSASLDQIADLGLRELETLSHVAKPITRSRIRIPGGEIEQVNYVTTMPNGRAVAVTQYLLVHGDHSYIILCMTPDKSLAKYAATFDQIGRSFRFMDVK